ncbi:DUF1150 family protein [Psychromarinibacter sp. C21-152]|uniref:DUF1150 family protein n=1 Tax=Psychromarinibacter sediminicola TaxID=3033385 RepID=A0AAE3NP11_9RHOB|nr:DUF1150 family protein [Psychromarinibacter sediminicola]MDF0601533.1 DUF1150 family protein [Psychromarinibacter sediminicola]
MNTEYELETDTESKIVYVRPVDVADLPEEVREQADGLDQIFAVHNSEGERLALVRDEKMAFALARQNDLAPVHVH